MLRFLITDLVRPISRRGGTAFGAYLIGIGVQTDTTTQIVAGLTALLGVVLDLVFSRINRKSLT